MSSQANKPQKENAENVDIKWSKLGWRVYFGKDSHKSCINECNYRHFELGVGIDI